MPEIWFSWVSNTDLVVTNKTWLIFILANSSREIGFSIINMQGHLRTFDQLPASHFQQCCWRNKKRKLFTHVPLTVTITKKALRHPGQQERQRDVSDDTDYCCLTSLSGDPWESENTTKPHCLLILRCLHDPWPLPPSNCVLMWLFIMKICPPLCRQLRRNST